MENVNATAVDTMVKVRSILECVVNCPQE